LLTGIVRRVSVGAACDRTSCVRLYSAGKCRFQNRKIQISKITQNRKMFSLRNPQKFLPITKILILPEFPKSAACRLNPRFFFKNRHKMFRNANFVCIFPGPQLDFPKSTPRLKFTCIRASPVPFKKYPSFKNRPCTRKPGTPRLIFGCSAGGWGGMKISH